MLQTQNNTQRLRSVSPKSKAQTTGQGHWLSQGDDRKSPVHAPCCLGEASQQTWARLGKACRGALGPGGEQGAGERARLSPAWCTRTSWDWYPADPRTLAMGTFALLKGSLLGLMGLLSGLELSGTRLFALKIDTVIRASGSAIFGSVLPAGS